MRKLLGETTTDPEEPPKVVTFTQTYTDNYVRPAEFVRDPKNGPKIFHAHTSEKHYRNATAGCAAFFQYLAESNNLDLTEVEKAACYAATESDKEMLRNWDTSEPESKKAQHERKLALSKAELENKIELIKETHKLELDYKKALFKQRRKQQSPLRKLVRCCWS